MVCIRGEPIDNHVFEMEVLINTFFSMYYVTAVADDL